jgi:hypothetical protein
MRAGRLIMSAGRVQAMRIAGVLPGEAQADVDCMVVGAAADAAPAPEFKLPATPAPLPLAPPCATALLIVRLDTDTVPACTKMARPALMASSVTLLPPAALESKIAWRSEPAGLVGMYAGSWYSSTTADVRVSRIDCGEGGDSNAGTADGDTSHCVPGRATNFCCPSTERKKSPAALWVKIFTKDIAYFL